MPITTIGHVQPRRAREKRGTRGCWHACTHRVNAWKLEKQQAQCQWLHRHSPPVREWTTGNSMLSTDKWSQWTHNNGGIFLVHILHRYHTQNNANHILSIFGPTKVNQSLWTSPSFWQSMWPTLQCHFVGKRALYVCQQDSVLCYVTYLPILNQLHAPLVFDRK